VARGAKKAKEDNKPVPAPVMSARTGGAVKPKGPRLSLDTNAEELLQTDVREMDVSIGGIVRRVAILLACLIAGGIGLYVWGLQFLD